MQLGIDIGGSSVKVAARPADGAWSLAQSPRYHQPAAHALAAAVAQAVTQALKTGAAPSEPTARSAPALRAVGVCLPGIVDPDTRRVVRSVNLPGLNGASIDELLREALTAGLPSAPPAIITDAHAAAHDWCESHAVKGRTLALSLGTGVGACVLDDRTPLRISGNSPGHLGQLDVSIEPDPADRPLGPDGGRGGLEAYIGARAMLTRVGPDPALWPTRLELDHTPLLALARAIRIAHAIYRPVRVVLLGGVGLVLRPLAVQLDQLIRQDLTSLARDGWTLHFGDDAFHAARGAALLSAMADSA